MTKVYVSDTNIWIDFRNAGLLNELFLLPLKLCSTDFVLNELIDLSTAELVNLGLQVESLDEAAILQLYELMVKHRNSSLADVSCYLFAKNTGYPLLTGDGKLRKQAMKDGIQVSGVLWLIDQLVANRLISKGRAQLGLEKMLLMGARLPQAECHRRIQEWSSRTLT